MIGPILTLFFAATSASYNEARAQAVRDNKPLVVFVGCPALEVKGAVVYATPRLDWQKTPGVVIGVCQPGYLEWVTTLPPMASVKDIESAISKAPRRQWTAPMPTPVFAPQFAPQFFRRGGGRSC